MIIVTGGAGFIGSNLVRALNARGETDLLVVDNLRQGEKSANLADCVLADYLDKDQLLPRLERDDLPPVRAILHQGACSRTTESDGRYMMETNFAYSKAVVAFGQRRKVPVIYASSAATYGLSETCKEAPAFERPLNVYGYSKLAFDQHLRHHARDLHAPVVGLRYFNVYGPREAHKGRMASVAWHFFHQLRSSGVCRLFGEHEGTAAGEQSRDFVYIDDVVRVVLHFLDNPPPHLSLLNVGTGQARTFNALAKTLLALEGQGRIEYIPFPADLVGKYQSSTCADLHALRAAGYQAPFLSLEEGLRRYHHQLAGTPATSRRTEA